MARSRPTREAQFLEKISRAINDHIKGKSPTNLKIISFKKKKGESCLEFEIPPKEYETSEGSYVLIMLKDAGIPGDSVKILYKLLVQKISSDRKPKNIINAVVTKGLCITNSHPNLNNEYMRKLWAKLSGLTSIC